VPSPINPPSGCPFHPRCYQAIDICKEQTPELRNLGGEHWASCHRV
jgi:oligopeptide/dipeptide ABC transporter ATP-binding protein